VIPPNMLGSGICLATSVPVSEFLTPDGGMNKEYLLRKRDSLLQGQAFYLGSDEKEHRVRIVKHYVYCQAIAAWFDYVSDGKGGLIPDRADQEIGVVDVGGETSDFTVMVPSGEGHAIDGNRSGSERTGVLDAVDEVRERLSERLKEQVPVALAREVLLKGSTKIRGKEVSAPDLVERACRTLGARVARDMSKRFRGSQGMFSTSKILVVGGGAHLLDKKTLLADYPQLEWVPQPQFANARGMLRYMVEVDGADEYFSG